jgi:hypothetical protein
MAPAAAHSAQALEGDDMADGPIVRRYLEIEKPNSEAIALYRNWSAEGAGLLTTALQRMIPSARSIKPAQWRSAIPQWMSERAPSRLVFPFEQNPEKTNEAASLRILGNLSTMNASPGIEPADVWCPVGGGDTTFGSRADALALIGAPTLAASGATGQGVNVVIVDQGLDGSTLPTYEGGWSQDMATAGAAPPDGHGMMIARNVLSVAPDASLWDCPMIPDAIEDVSWFVDVAADAINWVLDDIAMHQANGRDKWILVNSWAVYDRRTEYPADDYINNPSHGFNQAMLRADGMGIDVVFAAGNCGGFCPKSRCGPDDRGQGASILGANSLGCVLTAGAVRPDGAWIGYSSQGPGQSNLSIAKPDVCAPSQFADPDDGNPVNSGTSTSAALAAGVIAGLRSLPRKTKPTPEEMRTLLRDTAAPGEPNEEYQFGHGILDAGKALLTLPA